VILLWLIEITLDRQGNMVCSLALRAENAYSESVK